MLFIGKMDIRKDQNFSCVKVNLFVFLNACMAGERIDSCNCACSKDISMEHAYLQMWSFICLTLSLKVPELASFCWLDPIVFFSAPWEVFIALLLPI